MRRRTPITRSAVATAFLCAVTFGLGALAGALSDATARGGDPRRAGQLATTSPPAVLATCESDVPNLGATLAAMPSGTAAEVVGRFSRDDRAGFGDLPLHADADAFPAAPDATTLANVLFRLSEQNRNAVLSGLPDEQRSAVASALLAATMRFTKEGVAPGCP